MTNPLRRLWRAATPSSSDKTRNSQVQPVGKELLKDRRVVKRHFYPLPATVRYGATGTEERVGIYNFSDKGLCFRSEVRLRVGTSVEITAKLPGKPLFDGRTVRYFAQVTRVALERGAFTVGAVINRCETVTQGSVSPKTSPAEEVTASPAPGLAEKTALAPERKADRPKAVKPKREGRQFSRYKCGSQAQFRVSDTGKIFSAEITNLSLGGCHLQTAEPCPVGTSLEIVVQVGKARIYTQGRVTALQEEQGMGVKFESNLRECLQRLPRFVQVVSGAKPAHNCKDN